MEDQEKIVFHYTTIQGLLGIINNKSIWATNTLYLNDASELHYAKDLLKQELTVFRGTHPEFLRAEKLDESLGHFFLETLEDNINALLPSQHMGFFVCSFSEDGDLLSQWRGYCGDGGGFSLGFRLSHLKTCAEKARFSIKKCIYDQDKQISEIRQLLANLAATFNREISYSNDKQQAWDEKGKQLLADFFLKFIKLAPFLKHPKFAEEKEWRIMVTLKTNIILPKMKFRAGNTMVVPYLEMPLPLQGKNLDIDQIFVGPTSDRTLSATAVEMLLRTQGIDNSQVNCSTIPYRTQ